LVFDDFSFDSTDGDLFDLYYGVGVGMLNLKGFQHAERLATVQRYAHLANSLQQEEAQEERPESDRGAQE